MNKGRVKPTTGLNFRDKPNGDKIGVLKHNQVVELLDEITFFRVKTQKGEIGYVHGDYLEKMPSEDSVISNGIDDTGSSAPWSPEFKSVSYSNAYFIGEKIRVDQDFTHELDKLARFAKQTYLKIWITSSLRHTHNQVDGAIVKPASKSCHHIGHAIDMNLMYKNTLYNSKKLRRSNHKNLPQAVVTFIQLIREDTVLRWGGDFNQEDPVHIDDNLYNNDETLYLAKLHNRINTLNASLA